MRVIVATVVLSLAISACGDSSAAPARDAGEDGGGEGEDVGNRNDAGTRDSGTDAKQDSEDAGADSGRSDRDAGPELRCGNGVLNTDEICEGFELRDATCVSEGFTAGRLRCTDDCELDTSKCSTCGDGNITGPEVCEPDDVDGATCADELGQGYLGEVECAPDCTSLVTEGCRPEIPVTNFRSCDPGASDPCKAPADCVETSTGNFCFETCDTVATGGCSSGDDFCYDYDGQGICVPVPGTGEVCTTDSGCSEGTEQCIPTFDHAGGTEISICAAPCKAPSIGAGLGTDCPTNQACVPAPGGQTELQSQSTCGADQECDGANGYRCLPTSPDDSTPRLCARPVALCASPVPFFEFDGQSTLGSTCDLEYPSRGLNLCGIGANSAGNTGPMASAVCHPLRSGSDRTGVCVGFCDSAILNTVTDGFCGDGYRCSVPSQPEFFLAADETTPATCDPAMPRCTAENPDCLDIGRGPECARPAKMCITP